MCKETSVKGYFYFIVLLKPPRAAFHKEVKVFIDSFLSIFYLKFRDTLSIADFFILSERKQPDKNCFAP